MNKNILIGIAVLVAGGVVGWYVYSGAPATTTETEVTTTVETTAAPTGATESSQMANEKTTVTLTDAGFEPKNISVKAGTTVEFVNNSSVQMWVASAPHPTHSVFPEFDQLKGVAKGGVYEFTFAKIGTWKYHNHLEASQFGAVEVTE